jgi:hypothetical protein
LGTGLNSTTVDAVNRTLILPVTYKHMGNRLSQDNNLKNYFGVGFNMDSIGILKEAVNSTADISATYVMPLNIRFRRDFLQKYSIGVNANVSGAYSNFYALGIGGKYDITSEEDSDLGLYVGGDFTYARATYPVTSISYGLTAMVNRHLFDVCLIYAGFNYHWVVSSVNGNVMEGGLNFSSTNGYSGYVIGASVDFLGANVIFDWRYLYNQVFSIIVGVEL